MKSLYKIESHPQADPRAVVSGKNYRFNDSHSVADPHGV